ncbi:MAG TPA: hypothetical protein VGL56_10260 [Fimbriimonadaceae bacterium]|jgi:hypothetical protein
MTRRNFFSAAFAAILSVPVAAIAAKTEPGKRVSRNCVTKTLGSLECKFKGDLDRIWARDVAVWEARHDWVLRYVYPNFDGAAITPTLGEWVDSASQKYSAFVSYRNWKTGAIVGPFLLQLEEYGNQIPYSLPTETIDLSFHYGLTSYYGFGDRTRYPAEGGWREVTVKWENGDPSRKEVSRTETFIPAFEPFTWTTEFPFGTTTSRGLIPSTKHLQV